jgi:hypothetical protein
MYVNGQMTTVKTIPRMWGRGIKENGGGGKLKYNKFDIL